MPVPPPVAALLSPLGVGLSPVFAAWWEDRNTMLLLVALLLSVWLWMLVRRREEETQRRPRRPTPVNPDELGRTVLICLMGRDDLTWRSLFLNGAEAAQLLGHRADRYIQARTPEVLQEALERLAEEIPQGAIYAASEVDQDEQLHVLVKHPEEGDRRVHVGSVARVGVAWRLFGPRQQ